MGDAISFFLLLSGVGLLLLAASGFALANGLEAKLHFISSAIPGLWSFGLAAMLQLGYSAASLKALALIAILSTAGPALRRIAARARRPSPGLRVSYPASDF